MRGMTASEGRTDALAFLRRGLAFNWMALLSIVAIDTGIALLLWLQEHQSFWQPFVSVQLHGLAIAYCVNATRPWEGDKPLRRLVAVTGASNLIGFLVPRFSSSSYAEWHAIAAGRWNARLQDHRLTMVAAGLATLLLSIVLFGTLSTSFFPPQNSDYSRANITMARE